MTTPTPPADKLMDECRKAFEAHPQFCYLEFDRDRDAWGRGKYKHSHVQALFDGFHAAWSHPSDELAALLSSPELLEAVKQAIYNVIEDFGDAEDCAQAAINTIKEKVGV